MERRRWIDRLLDGIEWLGNKLPDPVILFLIALVLTWIASALLAPIAFSEIDPRTLGKDQLAQPLQIKNQLDGEALVSFVTRMVKNFIEFPPLGLVLVVLLGVGVAEHAGFINALIKSRLSITPAQLLTPMTILVGILSHAAGDSGYVVVIPLGAVMYRAAGRHPLAGIAAAFAAVSGGLSANFIPIMLDPLLQGLTEPAAQIWQAGHAVPVLCNYYFTAASSLLIILLGWYVTDGVVEPRLARLPVDGDPADLPTLDPLTAAERRGLCAGLLSIGLMIVGLATSASLDASPWQGPDGRLFASKTPFMESLVPFMFLFFLVPGIIYGYVAGSIRTHRDIIAGMSKAMSSMSYYLVLAFVAAQFIYVFKESNVGVLLAMKGGNLLRDLGVQPALLIVGIVALTTLFNLLIGSASAKWALLAPIFVPMMMSNGLSPDLTQAAFRVGDSCTNIVTPLMPYFPLVVLFCRKYVQSAGIGTLVSIMLPYSLSFLFFWTLLLLMFWGLEIPLGIDATYTFP